MIFNMSDPTLSEPAAVYGYTINAEVYYSGTPSSVWLPCGGRYPIMIIGYFDNGSSKWLFAQDCQSDHNPYQQENITTIDQNSNCYFSTGSSAGIYQYRVRGTSGKCKYSVVFQY